MKQLAARDGLLSLAILGGLLFALTTIDPRVRERVSELVSPSGVTSVGSRLGDVGGALLSAARTQSIENAPLMIFATVGILLFIVMFRS